MEREPYGYGFWSATIFMVLFFTLFVVGFLKPIKKREWRNLGIFEAFIVALYVEMYGFPLTIYILTTFFGIPLSFGHKAGHLNAVILERLGIMSLEEAWALVMNISSIFMWSGLIIMGIGWRKIYKGKGSLVTGGLYRYVRHPQYLGLILITTGMLVQWPTIPTLLMWPMLMFGYCRLARREEKELEGQFGQLYRDYKSRVKAFIPFLR